MINSEVAWVLVSLKTQVQPQIILDSDCVPDYLSVYDDYASSSCTDLIFTSLLNLLIDSGVHLFLHPNCHHQIVYAKFNLEIRYTPPYLREVLHYKDANTELIPRAFNGFDWTRAIPNTSVNGKLIFLAILFLKSQQQEFEKLSSISFDKSNLLRKVDFLLKSGFQV